MDHRDDIKGYWEQQAKLARDNSQRLAVIDSVKNIFADDQGGGTLKDKILRRLEIQSILKYIPEDTNVLDIGCGNGYSTYEFVARKNIFVTGVDYSQEMVVNAKQLQEEHTDDELTKRMEFRQMDVLHLSEFADASFDVAISERCLINIVNWDEQRKAINEIGRVLKPGGIYIMLEGFVNGLFNLNQLRKSAGLDDIKVVWHNLFFDENLLYDFASNSFDVLHIDNFCSTYMMISRVVHPSICEPEYDAKINHVAALMPNLGDYGYLKIFVMRKK